MMNNIYYIYIIVAAALIPILNNFFPILRQSYSYWLIPVLLVGFFICFCIIQALLLLFMILFTNVKGRISKNQKLFRFLVDISLSPLLRFGGIVINTKGTENMPSDRRMLIVCNHQHDFDPVIMLSVFKGIDIGFIGKKDIYEKMPFIARIMHRLHSLPIDRENNREAAKTIIKAIKLLNENVTSIGLFPEGYTSKNCELLPFRNGSLKIALKANVPIAVCVINNTRSIPKNLFKRKTQIDFRLLRIIEPAEYDGLDTSELGDMIHNDMQNALAEIRK